MKSIDYKILAALMKNSKISDRQLAKEIGVSQPTVTRRRARLEKEGLVEYTAIPNMGKLGYEIMAFSFSKWAPEATTNLLSTGELEKQVRLFLSRYPNVVFAGTGRGGIKGMESASISFHKTYADYDSWVRDVQSIWGKNIAEFESVLFSLKGNNVMRQITFKYLSEHLQSTAE